MSYLVETAAGAAFNHGGYHLPEKRRCMHLPVRMQNIEQLPD
jgi:hypothetical protein